LTLILRDGLISLYICALQACYDDDDDDINETLQIRRGRVPADRPRFLTFGGEYNVKEFVGLHVVHITRNYQSLVSVAAHLHRLHRLRKKQPAVFTCVTITHIFIIFWRSSSRHSFLLMSYKMYHQRSRITRVVLFTNCDIVENAAFGERYARGPITLELLYEISNRPQSQ